jgi:succinate dehydrogenase/fumarate reductase flavoprotein subunit
MKRNEESKDAVSRRGFIKTTALGVSATVLSGLNAEESSAKGKKIADSWYKEADVVVVGYGGAGVVAAITAKDNGARVLVLEKAPFRGGGSTSISFGVCTSPTSVKDAADYLYAACGGNDPGGSMTPKEVIEAWAEEVCRNEEWWNKMGIEHKELSLPEFKNLPGYSSMRAITATGMGQALFSKLDRHAKDRGIEVLFDSPAVELIQDPDTKEILGVKTRVKGEEKRIKAKRAVVICTGGFDFNEDMKRDFLKCYPMKFYGWKFNTGDGVKMCQKVGADLWHMDMLAGCCCAWFPEDPADTGYTLSTKSENFIWVNRFGKRFCNEAAWGRQIHKGWPIFSEFSFDVPGYSRIPTYLVFDETARKAGSMGETVKLTGREILPAELGGTIPWSKDNLAEVEKGWIKKGETLEALAAAIGAPMDAAALKATIDAYNGYCTAGKDPEFGRADKSLKPMETAPYYAVSLYPGMVCTHGGARRNGKAQILDPDRKPIPRLYSAGTFGSVLGRIYSVFGGNVGECCAFGRIAGRNAAAEKPWS